MTERVFHSGTPPHIGWWNASVCDDEYANKAWRWWNGEFWSMAAFDTSSATTAHIRAEARMASATVRWSHYWPDNARVPRVDPVGNSVWVSAINSGRVVAMPYCWGTPTTGGSTYALQNNQVDVESPAVVRRPLKQHEFRVEWVIEVSAASYREAAKAAHKIQRDPTSDAGVFNVTRLPIVKVEPAVVDLGLGEAP